MITLDEKNNMKKIIITNSHYSYLWDIINDYDDDDILLCSDSLKNYKFKHDTFIYDSTLNYVRRLIQILSNIDDFIIWCQLLPGRWGVGGDGWCTGGF